MGQFLDAGLLNRGGNSSVLSSRCHAHPHRTRPPRNQRSRSGHTAPLGIAPWSFSPDGRPPLRIGLLLDSQKMALFCSKIIQDIKASNFAKLELLVYRKAPAPPGPNSNGGALSSLRQRLFDSKSRKRALYDLYLRLDHRMKPKNHPLDQRDCSDLLTGIESLEVSRSGRSSFIAFLKTLWNRSERRIWMC